MAMTRMKALKDPSGDHADDDSNGVHFHSGRPPDRRPGWVDWSMFRTFHGAGLGGLPISNTQVLPSNFATTGSS